MKVAKQGEKCRYFSHRSGPSLQNQNIVNAQLLYYLVAIEMHML